MFVSFDVNRYHVCGYKCSMIVIFIEMSFQCLFIQNLVYLLGLLKNTQSKKTQFAL